MPRRCALLIVNKNSRKGRAADLTAGIQLLDSQGIDVIEMQPDSPADIAALIRRQRGAVDRVIVGGGDGTLNCAAEALLETGLPLGIVPLGTGNDLARTLQIPEDPIDACAVIATCAAHPIDLGCVNGRYFFNAASIGLGVEVNRRLSSEIKSRWGALGYVRSVMETLKRYRAFRAHIRCDGRAVCLRSIQIGVANGRHYGGGMTISEDAALDDRLLHLYAVKPQRLWGLVSVALALRSGRHGPQDVILRLQGREMEVRAARPLPVTTDGEMATHTPARFSLVADAVSVYVPESYVRDQELRHADERLADRPERSNRPV